MANRLASSTSPYLQQHSENPVDWYEWGDDAFAEARRRDVPLLISVGYAACHWCHVMAHESFEDEATAAYLNAHFVCVKVDREERPDVDAVYMTATQAMTGHGGWPMTVFATPSGRPFHCGTYYPPVPAHGMPSFGQVLQAVTDAWTNRRAEIIDSAEAIATALAAPDPGDRSGPGVVTSAVADLAVTGAAAGTASSGTHAPAHPPLVAVLGQALDALSEGFDAARGGFGGAPKFPPSMVLEWLLRHHARTGSATPLDMSRRTLEAMARGGVYDQLGGGFARYSVDAGWVVPHFEKMLYDNALLLRVYLRWWLTEHDPLARRVVAETADWLLRELRTAEGGFASSLDADSPGPGGRLHEGAFYVWTPAQLVAALGPDDGAWAAQVWSVTPGGTFEHGASVLQLRSEADDAERHSSVRERLLAARERRPRPARDDKVVTGWNGLAVAALAEAGAVLDRPDWVEAAATAAELLATRHLVDGRLVRASRGGVVGRAPGVLEDYAYLAEGVLALYRATGAERWVRVTGGLLDTVLAGFTDGAGGFFDTAADQTDPVLAALRRPREVADGPTPSGQAAVAGALLTYAALTGSRRHRQAAEAALDDPLTVAGRYPRAAGWALAVCEALLDGPREVAVVGPPDDPSTRALRRTALTATAPGAVLAVGPPNNDRGDDADPGSPEVALLAGRGMVGGVATAYVCRGFVCDRPTTDPTELATQLGAEPTTRPATRSSG